MQMYKCGSCGGELEYDGKSSICICSYCGSRNAVSPDVYIAGENQSDYREENAAVEFSMLIDSVFSLSGRGTAVTGHIESGRISVNDCVKILSDDGNEICCTVIEIEQFRKKLNSAKKGEHIGLILSGVTKQQIQRGDMVIKGKLDLAALNRHIISCYSPSEKIRAIDKYRKATGLGLKAAKEKVERLFAR